MRCRQGHYSIGKGTFRVSTARTKSRFANIVPRLYLKAAIEPHLLARVLGLWKSSLPPFCRTQYSVIPRLVCKPYRGQLLIHGNQTHGHDFGVVFSLVEFVFQNNPSVDFRNPNIGIGLVRGAFFHQNIHLAAGQPHGNQ